MVVVFLCQKQKKFWVCDEDDDDDVDWDDDEKTAQNIRHIQTGHTDFYSDESLVTPVSVEIIYSLIVTE